MKDLIVTQEEKDAILAKLNGDKKVCLSMGSYFSCLSGEVITGESALFVWDILDELAWQADYELFGFAAGVALFKYTNPKKKITYEELIAMRSK